MVVESSDVIQATKFDNSSLCAEVVATVFVAECSDTYALDKISKACSDGIPSWCHAAVTQVGLVGSINQSKRTIDCSALVELWATCSRAETRNATRTFVAVIYVASSKDKPSASVERVITCSLAWNYRDGWTCPDCVWECNDGISCQLFAAAQNVEICVRNVAAFTQWNGQRCQDVLQDWQAAAEVQQ